MSGPGLPTMQVLLDNFVGAYPYDITQYVRLVDGFSWSRGTPDEQSTASPGTLSIALDNTDGRFTYNGAAGPYGIGPDQAIRIKVYGSNRWTGRVQSWPVSWPTGGDEWSVVQATATDDLARAQRRTLRSSLEEEFLVDSPTAYYTLGEATGATQAADSSGNGMPPLTAAGTGTAFTFGTGTGPSSDGLPAVQMAGGQYLGASASTNYIGTKWSIEVWVNIPTVPVGFAQSLVGVVNSSSLGPSIFVDTSGRVVTSGLVAGPGITGPNICDGLTHQVVSTFDGATFSALYVDGVFIGSAGASTASAGALSVGQAIALTTPLVGTISHVATFPRDLLAARVASHYTAGHSDFLAETPSARLTRVASYLGLTTGTIDTGGSTTMGIATQSGRSVLDVVNDVAQSTQGFVWLDGSGALTSRNGYTITSDTTPTASLDANWFDTATVVESDMTAVVNYATGKANGSENVYTASNAFSVGVHGMYREDFEWNVATDAQALDRTNWKVNNYAGAMQRVPSLTLDMLTLSGANLTAALNLDVGKFLHITGLPSQSPTVVDLIVTGTTETVTTTSWTLTLNCALHGNFAAWILGDALWGTLGATTKLYF